MPKIFDRKEGKIESIKNNKCSILKQSNKFYSKLCEYCGEKNNIIYRCIDCSYLLCEYCMLKHIVKENNLYECEKCEDIYDNKKDINLVESRKYKDFYALCDNCIKKM